MTCPKCSFEQDENLAECLRCGIVFSKWRMTREEDETAIKLADECANDRSAPLKTVLFPTPDAPNILIVGARALFLGLLTLWSFKFLSACIAANDAGNSFMHLVNLPFHEAGHIIFMPFGRFMQVLGGTLGQLLMPAVCLFVLLLKTRDAFGAAVAQWWLAESFMDIAPYIDDARSLDLILLGGVTGKDVADYHDWEYLLRTLGLLSFDHTLAYLAHGTGMVLMVAALLWAAANLRIQLKACSNA